MVANGVRGTALIVGATGVIGQAALAAFVDHGWPCIALSRRVPECTTGDFEHLAVDLSDVQATRTALQAPSIARVTHVVYAALFEKPGLIAGWQEQDQMQTNLQMLTNLFQPLQEVAQLQQVSLLQGTKAYGAHLHAIAIPAKEQQSRDEHANFYWLQEDYLKQQQRLLGAAAFNLTILRPQIVFGYSHGSAMNLIPVIGVYAALCRSARLPFSFPGGADTLQEAVDADLLARVLLWSATSEVAANQVFNVTNGDLYRWRDLWPALAEHLKLPLGADKPLSMAVWLPQQEQRWQALVQQHALKPLSLQALLGESHFYADALFGYGQTQPAPPALVSTIKLRQAGFAGCVDTQDMLHRLLDVAAERKLIPPFG